MRILAIDSATKTVGLALLQEEKTIGELQLDLGRHHAEVLLPALEKLLSLTGLGREEIELLACTVGPGSFTGVRIGVSTVKGLALALNRPIAPVSTLAALAQNATPPATWVCPLVDARKGQVYTALYRLGLDGVTSVAVTQKIAHIEGWLTELPPERILFLGDGVLAHRELIQRTLSERALFGNAGHHCIMASAVGRLGLQMYRQGETVDPLHLTPCYLQLSAAEAKAEAGRDSCAGAADSRAGDGSEVDLSQGLR